MSTRIVRRQIAELANQQNLKPNKAVAIYTAVLSTLAGDDYPRHIQIANLTDLADIEDEIEKVKTKAVKK